MSTPEKPEKTDKHEKAAKPEAPPTPKALLGLVGANLLVTVGLAAVVVVTRPGPAAAAAAPAHEAAAEEHGEKKAEHGEEKKAEHGEEKNAEHGEEKPAEHGEKKAEHGEEKKAEHAESKPSDDGPVGGSTARLDDIIVHLRNPEVDRYARLTLDVEMADPSQIAQLQQRTPQIRDTVITALSEETFESLRGAEGLLTMKEKLRQRIDAVVPGDVRALYVSGFIVQ